MMIIIIIIIIIIISDFFFITVCSSSKNCLSARCASAAECCLYGRWRIWNQNSFFQSYSIMVLSYSILFNNGAFLLTAILTVFNVNICTHILAYFIKAELCDMHAVCVSLCLWIPYWLLNAWTNLHETWYYIMASEPISTAYFINLSHQSVWLYVHPSFRC
jgi:hypothetical protein